MLRWHGRCVIVYEENFSLIKEKEERRSVPLMAGRVPGPKLDPSSSLEESEGILLL